MKPRPRKHNKTPEEVREAYLQAIRMSDAKMAFYKKYGALPTAEDDLSEFLVDSHTLT